MYVIKNVHVLLLLNIQKILEVRFQTVYGGSKSYDERENQHKKLQVITYIWCLFSEDFLSSVISCKTNLSLSDDFYTKKDAKIVKENEISSHFTFSNSVFLRQCSASLPVVVETLNELGLTIKKKVTTTN